MEIEREEERLASLLRPLPFQPTPPADAKALRVNGKARAVATTRCW